MSSSRFYIGGLVGAYEDYVSGSTARVAHNTVTGPVTATGGYVGGLFGYFQTSSSTITVEQNLVSGNINSPSGDGAGGLSGYTNVTAYNHNMAATFQDNYTTGHVTGNGHIEVGGLFGFIQSDAVNGYASVVTIRRNYSAAAVSGDSKVGGLVGANYGLGSPSATLVFTNNFAVGLVQDATPGSAGGVIGYNGSNGTGVTSSGNYFDATATGRTNCTTSNTLAGCAAVNTAGAQPAYFMGGSTNAPLSAWDFATVWRTVAGGLPVLRSVDGDDAGDTVEANAPGSGDANGDGTEDFLQANVTSIPNPLSGHYASLETSSACSNTSAAITPEDAAVPDIAYQYPTGMIGFTTSCGTPGFNAAITQYYYGLSAAGLTARAYNAATHGYSTVPGAVISQITLNGQTVTKLAYHVIDGGPLDQDGTANGTIVDPVGLAVQIIGAPNTGFGGLHH